jgi:hypothetical protein
MPLDPELDDLKNDPDVLFLSSYHRWQAQDRKVRMPLREQIFAYLGTMPNEEQDALVLEKGWDHIAEVAVRLPA